MARSMIVYCPSRPRNTRAVSVISNRSFQFQKRRQFPIRTHNDAFPPALIHRPFGNRQDDSSGSNRENISSTPLHISGMRPVSTPLAQSSRVLFWRFRAGFPALHQWKGILKDEEGQRMNDAQTLVLVHTVAWPILIWALCKTWS